MWPKAFLLINGVLYLGLGLWCTLAPTKTSSAIGYGLTNGSARSEYLVVYGGLELGMGLFFVLCATRAGMLEAGLWFAALSYTCLAAYRWVTIVAIEDVGGFVHAMVAIETVMAALSWWLLWSFVLGPKATP